MYQVHVRLFIPLAARRVRRRFCRATMPRASSVHALWLMSAAVGAAARPGVLRLLSPVDDHSHDGPSPAADIASWGRGAQTVSLDRTLYMLRKCQLGLMSMMSP